MCSGRGTIIQLHFKNEGQSNLGHRILEDDTWHKEIHFWEQTVVTVSYLFHHDSLLQNGKNLITKCDSYIIKILGIQLPYIFQVQSQSIQTIANILYIYIYIIYIYMYIYIYIYIYIYQKAWFAILWCVPTLYSI